DPPQQVAGGVGDQEVAADLGGDVLRQGQDPVGLGELGGLVVPVGVAAPAGADPLVDGGAIGLDDDQPVWAGVGEDQASVVKRGELGGQARCLRDPLRQGGGRGAAAQRAGALALGEQLADQGVEAGGVPLPR